MRIRAAVKRRRQIEKDAFLAHLLQLLVADLVAVFDGIRARIDRRLNAGRIGGMDRNLEMLTMGFLRDCRELGDGNVVTHGHLDDVDVLKHVPSNRLSRPVGAVHQQKFLLEDRVAQRRIEILDVRPSRDQLPSLRLLG